MKKRQKYINYEQHAQKALEEQKRMAMANAQAMLTEKWQKVLKEHRNMKLEPIARFFYPPKWYRETVSFVIRVIMFPIIWFFKIFEFCTYGWMIMLSNKINLWGISKKVTYPKKDVVKLVIKAKGKKVEEFEVKV